MQGTEDQNKCKTKTATPEEKKAFKELKEVLEDKFLCLSMESVFEAVSVELKPTVGIATDKGTYQPGETMQITLDLENPTPTAQLLLVAWYLEISGEGNQTTIVEPFPVLLPAGADYSIQVGMLVDGWGTTDFTATWSVELLNPVTHEVVDSDTAEWNYEVGEVK